MSRETESLQARISDLERELQQKEEDLGRFRKELVSANTTLETLISQLSQELKMAHLIQKVLAPTEYPHISGIEFSSKFIPGVRSGGDYFDIFEHEDKFRFGIIVASASGYGMSALFLSVLLKMTGQLEAKRGGEPHKMIEKMAAELVPAVGEKDKAHLFYGVIDRRTFEMTYSIVGDIPALLFSSNTGKLTQLDCSTPPISSTFAAQPKGHTISLNSRDRLILGTEGTISARNVANETFGIERLSKAVLSSPKSGVHELRNEVLYKLEQFVGTPEFNRDVTLVVTEIKDRVIKLAKG